MYGKDNIQIRVYNVKGSPKKGGRKTLEKKKTKEQVTRTRTLNS